jgi:hypothetical protein
MTGVRPRPLTTARKSKIIVGAQPLDPLPDGTIREIFIMLRSPLLPVF